MVSLLFSLLNILFFAFVGGFGFGKFLFEFDGGGLDIPGGGNGVLVLLLDLLGCVGALGLGIGGGTLDGGGGAEDGAEEGGSDLLGLVGLVEFFLLGGLGPTDDDGGADGGADLGTGGIPDGAAGLDEVDFGGGPDGLGGDLLNLSPFCMILVFFETVFGGTGAFLEAVFALLGGGLPLGRGGLPLGIDGFLVGNSGGGHLGGGGGI